MLPGVRSGDEPWLLNNGLSVYDLRAHEVNSLYRLPGKAQVCLAGSVLHQDGTTAVPYERRDGKIDEEYEQQAWSEQFQMFDTRRASRLETRRDSSSASARSYKHQWIEMGQVGYHIDICQNLGGESIYGDLGGASG